MKSQLEVSLLAHLPIEPLFNVRFQADCRELQSSLQKWGVLNPIHVYVREDGTRFILDGWQRVQFLKQNQSVESLAVILHHENVLPIADAFLIYMDLNVALRPFNLIEKALLIKKAQDLFLGKPWPKALVTGLGVAFQPAPMKEYRDLLKLPEFVQKYIVNNGIALHVALKFLDFEANDMVKLANQLFVYPLNQNKLGEILDLLQDLSRRESVPASQVFQDVLTQISGAGLAQQKEKLIRETLKKRKNPRFEEQMQHFLQKTKHIPIGAQTSVAPAPFFEDDYVEVKSRIYNHSDIQNLIQVLTHQAWGDIFDN